ncbi:MAG: diacylglycerol/lipid kinase family protein, partial [Bacteroidota bacterium]
MKIHFIVNPEAGRGKGRGVLRKLESIPKKERLLYTLHVTAGPTSTIENARHASKDSDVVVAVGGDGTVNQVANGLVGSEALLGIIPIGSGNDFANMFRLPSHVETAISILKNRKVVAIDVGRVGYITDRLRTLQERYFVNAVGIGFDAAVAYETTRVRALKGRPLYLFGLLKTLTTYKPSAFKVSWENITLNNTHLLVAVGNGVCVGGGFYLTPYAKLDDGKLDVCVVDSASVM